jgi:hypothetical protein
MLRPKTPPLKAKQMAANALDQISPSTNVNANNNTSSNSLTDNANTSMNGLNLSFIEQNLNNQSINVNNDADLQPSTFDA